MEHVLGVSLTSAAMRLVFVEGITGEGFTVDRRTFDIAAIDDAIAAAGENALHAIGVTWADEAEAAASTFLQELSSRDLQNVISVSELEAADALATGLAELTTYDEIAVCIVEPDAAIVAIVSPQGVTVDRMGRPTDDSDELARRLVKLWDLGEWQPEAVFVLGSADDLDVIVSALEGVTVSPIVSAALADLALSRGAALVSGREEPGSPARIRRARVAVENRDVDVGPRRCGADFRGLAECRARPSSDGPRAARGRPRRRPTRPRGRCAVGRAGRAQTVAPCGTTACGTTAASAAAGRGDHHRARGSGA